MTARNSKPAQFRVSSDECRIPWACVATILMAIFLNSAQARAATAGCPAASSEKIVIDLTSLANGGGRDEAWSNVWGRERLLLLPREDETAGPVLRVAYPKGSVNPGNAAAPQGGAGFIYRMRRGATRACLSYKVRFPDGFAFVKGGKLPGLFGGDAPRGCTPREVNKGFSARLMWRTGGAGELYAYAPDRATACGQSLSRGAWTFQTGRWIAVSQEIDLTGSLESGDRILLSIDGNTVPYKLQLRSSSATLIDGLLFSTFFGGSDPSWASPGDQFADFADFAIWLYAFP